MNSTELQAVVDETHVTTLKILTIKGGEYAGSEDMLGNFKRGGNRIGTHPLQVLWIYAAKHIDSIETYVRDTAEGVQRPRSESIEGRFNDLINYCILAKALIREASQSKPAVVDDRDLHQHGGRLYGELPVNPIHTPTLVSLASTDLGTVTGNGDLVHSMESGSGVQPAKDIQRTPREALTTEAAITAKAGGERCLSCWNAKTSPFAWPCNICIRASRFTSQGNQG